MNIIEYLLRPAIQKFIVDHENDDVAVLALKKPPSPDWPYKLILDQIKARQKAARKLPHFLKHPDTVLPPAEVIEQASSAATARYKASLVKGESFADLTGGAGADTLALAQNFTRGLCAEQDEHAAALLAHNLKILGADHVAAHHDTAENILSAMDHADLIYIDPQRRDATRKGLYRLADCSPDVTALLPALKTKAKTALIKTSPMLDIAQAAADLIYVREIHVVEYQGDCKEVLYLLDFTTTTATVQPAQRHAVCLNDEGEIRHKLTFTMEEETTAPSPLSAPLKFLYEPGPAFLKAGAFNTLATRYGLHKLHNNTHLYTSQTLRAGFPGRAFEIVEILPADRKAISFDKANLSVRNFPQDVNTLRKKLGLKDGGDEFLFACTTVLEGKNEQKILLHCRKSLSI